MLVKLTPGVICKKSEKADKSFQMIKNVINESTIN